MRALPVDYRRLPRPGLRRRSAERGRHPLGGGEPGGGVRPRARLPGGYRPPTRRRPAATARARGGGTSTSSTGPTTRTAQPSAGCPSPGPPAITATTGRGPRSASAPTARSPSGPPRTTATTTSRAPGTGARTPASASCGTSPRLIGARPEGGWGPQTGWLFVSGGSHAGNAKADPHDVGRVTPGRRLLLVPLEPITAARERARFAIPPPWRKHLWRDPEAEGTD